MSGGEGLWERAFQLAYLIVPDRASAYQIAGRAIEKLGLQRSREKRRVYWRFRNTKLRIRRISRPDEDNLQWLVYLESEEFERQQERNDQQTEIDMVIRYVKHLVYMTTGTSSFYVNVGLNRLLRNYSTPEVQQVYEFVTEHYPGPEEYRKVKGRLMNQLAARFEGCINICKSQYRELRFETDEDQERWISLVDECLEAFTPWSSRKACWRISMKSDFEQSRPGRQDSISPGLVDGIETQRLHWFMHSPCYGELVKKLGLDSPDKRLSVPRFLRRDNDRHGTGPTLHVRNTEPLTDAELKALQDRIRSDEEKRQKVPLQPLTITCQGVICGRLDPARDEKIQFAIPEGTRLLEVKTDCAGTDLLLATHWIDYAESGITGGKYTIALKNGRELILTIMPESAGNELEGAATVAVESRFSSNLAGWFHRMVAFLPTRQTLPRYALASAILVAFGWLGAAMFYRNRLAKEPSPAPIAAGAVSEPTAPGVKKEKPVQMAATYFLSSQIPSVRGPGNPEEPVVTFNSGDSLVMLEVSVPQPPPVSYRVTLSPFLGEQELLTENLLIPMKKGNEWVVKFTLPFTFVANDTHYLLTLATLDNKGAATPITRFVFRVRK